MGILRFGRKFLSVTKDFSLLIEPKMSFKTPNRGCLVLRSSTGGGLEEEPPAYTATLEIIFIPLATLKAACRNQASNWFLMMVVNLARLARPWRWLMPKYCFYPVAASACKEIMSFLLNFRSLKSGFHDEIGKLRGVRYIGSWRWPCCAGSPTR
jgi:hypothetical protein